MALQDLTPQLRTRLNRMERAVGIFVAVAALVLLAGFFYYLHQMASRKGWFLTKVTYFTYVNNAAGLKVGDPVKLMGFDAGQISMILPENPDSSFNVYIEFKIKEPNYGYIWFPDSRVKVTSGDFLGNRFLEVTKGGTGGQTGAVYRATYRDEVRDGKREITGVWDRQNKSYKLYTPDSKYWLEADESPAVTQRLEKIANQVEQALPQILGLTNQLAAVLTNSALAAANLNALARDARPAASHLAAITERLRDFDGALGRWLFSPNLNRQIEFTVTNLNATLVGVDTNLLAIAEKLSVSLDNLANITSNLNVQVQANTNLLRGISEAVTGADELMQGLQRHWMLRSAFKEPRTNSRPPQPAFPPGWRVP